jgi:hypothetical protein
MPLSGSDGSERLALSGAQFSCRADRFFVAAGALTLSLNVGLFKCFFQSSCSSPKDKHLLLRGSAALPGEDPRFGG